MSHPLSSSSETAPLELHGFHVPLNTEVPSFHRIIGRDWRATPLTHAEANMMKFMSHITEKPGWDHMVFDDAIVDKWRNEWNYQPRGRDGPFIQHAPLSPKLFEYCIEELHAYTQCLDENGFVPAIDADATVFKSDTLISEDLRQALVDAVAPLENVPAAMQDWHPRSMQGWYPGSKEQVLDIVDPSLFPLVYGRSRVITDDTVTLDNPAIHVGKGKVMPKPPPSEDDNFQRSYERVKPHYSSNFQWLPCQVAFRDDDAVEITSYINNVHPEHHRDLYSVLEKILAKTIPMWDAAIAGAQHRPRPGRIHLADITEEFIESVTWSRFELCPDPRPHAARLAAYPLPSLSNLVTNLRKDFHQAGLQVVFKIASIHLTPSQPTCHGGTWHIEGMVNEQICASALYYFSSSNIGPSNVAFREPADREALQVIDNYDQWDCTESLFAWFECGGALQFVGDTHTPQGRLLAFPNVLEYRLSPFSLVDRSQPGERKLLAMFLVDPHVRIPSTAHVAPQQQTWWHEMLLGLDKVGALPVEMVDQIAAVGGPEVWDLDEAKAMREELMAERTTFHARSEMVPQNAFRREKFDFCEHFAGAVRGE